ncbi:MAG: hypothetical protein V3U76_05865 [Granulosicoccus sp.]
MTMLPPVVRTPIRDTYYPTTKTYFGDDNDDNKAILDLSKTKLPVEEGNKALEEGNYEGVKDYVAIAKQDPNLSKEDAIILEGYDRLADLGIAARTAGKNHDGAGILNAVNDGQDIYIKFAESNLPGAADAVKHFDVILNHYANNGVTIEGNLPVSEGIAALASGQFDDIINFEGSFLTDADEDVLDDLQSLAQIGKDINTAAQAGDFEKVNSLMSDAKDIIAGMGVSDIEKETITDSLASAAFVPTALPVKDGNQALQDGNYDGILQYAKDRPVSPTEKPLGSRDTALLDAYSGVATLGNEADAAIKSGDTNTATENIAAAAVVFIMLGRAGVEGAAEMAELYLSMLDPELRQELEDKLEETLESDGEMTSSSNDSENTQIAIAAVSKASNIAPDFFADPTTTAIVGAINDMEDLMNLTTLLPVHTGNQALLTGSKEGFQSIIDFTNAQMETEGLSSTDHAVLSSYDRMATAGLMAIDAIESGETEVVIKQLDIVIDEFELLETLGVRGAAEMKEHYIEAKKEFEAELALEEDSAMA